MIYRSSRCEAADKNSGISDAGGKQVLGTERREIRSVVRQGLNDPLKYSSRRYVKRAQRGPWTKEEGVGRVDGD